LDLFGPRGDLGLVCLGDSIPRNPVIFEKQVDAHGLVLLQYAVADLIETLLRARPGALLKGIAAIPANFLDTTANFIPESISFRAIEHCLVFLQSSCLLLSVNFLKYQKF
jgi:hypothetical protein